MIKLFVALLVVGASTSLSQSPITADSTHPSIVKSSTTNDPYADLLLTTIQTNSDGETALKSTIIEVRIYALIIVIGLVTLSRPFKQNKRLIVFFGALLLIIFMWGYDVFNNDMISSYQNRSVRIVQQIDSMRTYGADASASMTLPEMQKHSQIDKIRNGVNCVQIFWYLGIVMFAGLIVFLKEYVLENHKPNPTGD